MDLSVKNLQDEKLGKVENLIVDLSAGRIVAVIVSSGGFLGMGDELSAVPPTALRMNPDRDALQLDTTKEALSSAPHFKANQWPEVGSPAYAEGCIAPTTSGPPTTNTVSTADNTARNAATATTVNDRRPGQQFRGRQDRPDRKEILPTRTSMNAKT
jgi:hypothetical protein